MILDFSGAVGYFPTIAAAGRTAGTARRLKQTGQRGAAIRSRIVKGLNINE